jgi:MarC family integral membrane protein
LPENARRNVALRATLIAASILAGSALIGDWLLRALSIGLPAFRIAGGLLLFSIASEMVFGAEMKNSTGMRGAQDHKVSPRASEVRSLQRAGRFRGQNGVGARPYANFCAWLVLTTGAILELG